MHMNMHMHMHAVQRFPVTVLSAHVGLFCVIVGLFDLLISHIPVSMRSHLYGRTHINARMRTQRHTQTHTHADL